MTQRYAGVRERWLDASERAIRTDKTRTPWVIEAAGSARAQFLAEFLHEHGPQILADVSAHGAVLLRGFELAMDAQFEATVLAVRGLRGIDRVMLSEAGRTVVEGSRFVLYTNKFFETGGTFAPVGHFHTENHYVPDVPRYISFFCRTAPRQGGETGLVDTTGLYADLGPVLREKLERHSFFVRSVALEVIARRYRTDVAQCARFCESEGLTVEEAGGVKYLILHKPSVMVNPATGERCLTINLWGELDSLGLGAEVRHQFESDYANPQWRIHRRLWKGHRARPVRIALEALDTLAHPRRTLGRLAWSWGSGRRVPTDPVLRARVASVFQPYDIVPLARSIRANFTSFTWKPGDVLIVDNLKMAHAGMPGSGRRLLRAMICNPLRIDLRPGAPGLCEPREQGDTAGARLHAWIESGRARGEPLQGTAR